MEEETYGRESIGLQSMWRGKHVEEDVCGGESV